MKTMTTTQLISDVYLMDCMELMRGYPDKHFDLAVVDPPYGIGESGAKNKTRGGLVKARAYKAFAGNDVEAAKPEYFRELMRVSKNQVIWGANHYISRIPFDSSAWIVWDKVNGQTDFADCELAWTSFKSAVRMFSFMWNGMQQGNTLNGKIMQGNTKLNEKRIHPTQKPVALYDWIFKNYAKPGQLILDTHLGSGSSRIAADKAGLNFIGCELDADYFAAHEKRWKEYKMQLKLF